MESSTSNSISIIEEAPPEPVRLLDSEESVSESHVRIHTSRVPSSRPASHPDKAYTPKITEVTIHMPTLPESPPRVGPLPGTASSTSLMSFESDLWHKPGQATCPSCETQVITQVVYCVGRYAWLSCLAFILSGMIFGCCLIPFCVDYFKDAYHICPKCQWSMRVHRQKCCV